MDKIFSRFNPCRKNLSELLFLQAHSFLCKRNLQLSRGGGGLEDDALFRFFFLPPFREIKESNFSKVRLHPSCTRFLVSLPIIRECILFLSFTRARTIIKSNSKIIRIEGKYFPPKKSTFHSFIFIARTLLFFFFHSIVIPLPGNV